MLFQAFVQLNQSLDHRDCKLKDIVQPDTS